VAPEWRHGFILEAFMGVSLSIKDVPEALAQRLRERAERNHRSLQRELMALIEVAASAPTVPAALPFAAAPPAACEEPASYRAEPSPGPDGAPSGPADALLSELDAIVTSSRWGPVPLLSREQLHDRALAREIDFDARRAEPDAASGARTPAAR